MFRRLRLSCRNSFRAIAACAVTALLPLPAAQISVRRTKSRPLTGHRSGWPSSNSSPGNEVLMVLALSGGGSRAAYFSAMTMLQMEEVFSPEGINLLKEVNAITSVSGGSLPAAYYAISQAPAPGSATAPSGRMWDEKTVKDLMPELCPAMGRQLVLARQHCEILVYRV